MSKESKSKLDDFLNDASLKPLMEDDEKHIAGESAVQLATLALPVSTGMAPNV